MGMRNLGNYRKPSPRLPGAHQRYPAGVASLGSGHLASGATAVLPKFPDSNSCKKKCQIGLYDPAEADLELLCNSWSAGSLGERLYAFSVSCCD